MSLFVVLFKVIPYLVPFLKEMLIGKKTWKQAFKENRGKTMLAGMVIASLVLNMVLLLRAGTLAFEHLELTRAHRALEARYHQLEKAKSGIRGSAKHPVDRNVEVAVKVEKEPKPAVKVDKVANVQHDEAADIKAAFELMRQRENAEH